MFIKIEMRRFVLFINSTAFNDVDEEISTVQNG
jgi:hypothetical protein